MDGFFESDLGKKSVIFRGGEPIKEAEDLNPGELAGEDPCCGGEPRPIRGEESLPWAEPVTRGGGFVNEPPVTRGGEAPAA